MADPRFQDGKADDALRTIGEVSDGLGIKTHVLRYWEQQFPTLRPLKRSGGRRYYRAEDIALIEKIDQLVNQQGYTLKGAKQALKGGAETQQSPVATGAPSSAAKSVDILPQLQAIRSKLAKAIA